MFPFVAYGGLFGGKEAVEGVLFVWLV